MPLSFSFGERLVRKPVALTRSGHPNPSLYLIVRRSLYNSLLSFSYIILPKNLFCIKNNIRFH